MRLVNRASREAMARLGGFAAVALTVVSGVFYLVRPTIESQKSTALLAAFCDIAPKLVFAPDFLAHPRAMTLEGVPVIVYTAYRRGEPAAYFIRATTGKGYNGDITLLIGIAADNFTLLGVRALAHQETPGLGDKIETHVSQWIHGFDGQSLKSRRFAVKKDGGDFDAFTGATITPRAVVGLVREILRAWQNHRQERQ